ncbi:MAG: UDP-N-acetylmuramoyl-L-alanyl-D-glutamate--2,6-diaminopimelate ligase [Spirochaetales bacterium]|nr:UDP-N-acetylmuramoyl-L-alanyl-D-glutamate--2,6-diaminopimelate ligase [Spirochaetales bacterium]
MKTVDELIKNTETESVIGDTHIPAETLSADSRTVQKHAVFFAIPGIHYDGHEYIRMAVEKGASTVIHEKELPEYDNRVCYVRVKSVRRAMAPVAAAFYDYPSREMHVIGVTGTDGKSSTVFFITQLLGLAGIKCGCISTVMVKTDREFEKNPFRQSTPDAPEIQNYLRQMADNGCGVAVIEATSHGLSARNSRLADVAFDTAVLTHISHEHLEFHGNLDQYIDDKANLFRFTKANNGTAIINFSEKHKDRFASVSGPDIVYYSASAGEAEIHAEDIRKTERGYAFTVHFGPDILPAQINLPGRFNIDNCLAALAAAHKSSGISPERLVAFLPELVPLKGRMNAVEMGQPFTVIIDYAHSPGSFEKQFPLWREEAKKRLIACFGSAGERDTAKRPLQGKVAAAFSDIIILTDEDPRGEDPMNILEEIAAGCHGYEKDKDLFLIPDRRMAIARALELAEPGDYLVFLGKGHESSIIYRNTSIPWDEYTILEEELAKKGYS